MKNITLSADERLIEEAREKARRQNTTLNEQFRSWLADYVGRRERANARCARLTNCRKTVRTGDGSLRGDEMNER
jgi:hypothetical protein